MKNMSPEELDKAVHNKMDIESLRRRRRKPYKMNMGPATSYKSVNPNLRGTLQTVNKDQKASNLKVRQALAEINKRESKQQKINNLKKELQFSEKKEELIKQELERAEQ